MSYHIALVYSQHSSLFPDAAAYRQIDPRQPIRTRPSPLNCPFGVAKKSPLPFWGFQWSIVSWAGYLSFVIQDAIALTFQVDNVRDGEHRRAFRSQNMWYYPWLLVP